MIHYKVLFFSGSYFVYDFIIYYFIVQAKGALAIQTYVHHILAMTSFWLSAYTEGPPVVIGVCSMCVELSTIFINLRWFTFEFKIPG